MSHSGPIRFYVAAVTGVVVTAASVVISYLQWTAADRQAQTAERTYQLEISKNSPDFRLDVKPSEDGTVAVTVKLLDGVAREPKVNLYARSGSVAFEDPAGKAVVCNNYWSSISPILEAPHQKSGDMAVFRIDNNYISDALNGLAAKVSLHGYKFISINGPDRGKYSIVLKVSYQDVFGKYRTANLKYMPDYSVSYLDDNSIGHIHLTAFDKKDRLPLWCDEILEQGSSRRVRLDQTGIEPLD